MSDLGTEWMELTNKEIDNSVVLTEYGRINMQEKSIGFLAKI